MPNANRAIPRPRQNTRILDHRVYNQTRDPAITKYYNSNRWKKVRAIARKRDRNLCVICRAAGLITSATEVDHIEPSHLRPDLFFVLKNLRSLCHPCHVKNGGKRDGHKRIDG